jgi:hypothetical protein
VLPEGTGDSEAAALELEIAKTLAPVKSYADVKFKIRSPRPTDFAWGVSYGYAIADLARAFAGFSHPPRDPSPRLGFWDKFRQSLHWRVAFDFAGPCHLHLKGMSLARLVYGDMVSLITSNSIKALEIRTRSPDTEQVSFWRGWATLKFGSGTKTLNANWFRSPVTRWFYPSQSKSRPILRLVISSDITS